MSSARIFGARWAGRRIPLLLMTAALGAFGAATPLAAEETPDAVQAGLREFFAKTARPDGTFADGIEPDYHGMSDSVYSDLAAVTYAVALHKTFGWKLPFEERTIEFLLARQRASGDFFNVAGTVDPASAEGRVYNTTQGVVALHALGRKPRYPPLSMYEEILRADYKTLPPYSTSFFPLAYLASGEPIPAEADFWPNLELELQTGRFVEKENLLPTRDYSPRGNHFFAYSIKDTVIKWLDPKPITYREPDPQSIDFKGSLTE